MCLKQPRSRLLMIRRSQEATNTLLYLLPRSDFYRTVAFFAANSKGTCRYRHVPFMRYNVNNKLSIKRWINHSWLFARLLKLKVGSLFVSASYVTVSNVFCLTQREHFETFSNYYLDFFHTLLRNIDEHGRRISRCSKVTSP